jgi:hypothetical protein
VDVLGAGGQGDGRRGDLTNLAARPEGAYFLFAAVKVADCHGGPERAVAVY